MDDGRKKYNVLPTILKFHESSAQYRAIVGSVGSGKTTGAAWEVCYYLPWFLFNEYKEKRTRWVVVRNTSVELKDTTQATLFDWFDWGKHRVQRDIYNIAYPDGPEVEILFRACDRPDDIKKFKSLELTGYWADESNEIAEDVKKMLKNRIGRFPKKCPVKFGIETSNPPDVEHPMYSMYKWHVPPPGPMPSGVPLKKHEGFWQPPYENRDNLRDGYYEDLAEEYRDSPDWLDTYVLGKPGVFVQGKLVYNNFLRDVHVAKEPILWSNVNLIRGWDNTGNHPACVVLQSPSANQIQVLKEFTTDRMGIVDFTKHVVFKCNELYPGAKYQDWADPKGADKHSDPAGGLTSNADLMRRAAGVMANPSEHNWIARKESVETQLNMRDGLLIDPSCTRLINGFIAGYCFPLRGHVGGYEMYGDMPIKNKWSDIHDALQYACLKMVKSSSLQANIDFMVAKQRQRMAQRSRGYR